LWRNLIIKSISNSWSSYGKTVIVLIIPRITSKAYMRYIVRINNNNRKRKNYWRAWITLMSILAPTRRLMPLYHLVIKRRDSWLIYKTWIVVLTMILITWRKLKINSLRKIIHMHIEDKMQSEPVNQLNSAKASSNSKM